MAKPPFGPRTSAVEAIIARAARLSADEIRQLEADFRPRSGRMAGLAAVQAGWTAARRAKLSAEAQRASAAAFHAVPALFDGDGLARSAPFAAEAAGFAALAAALGPRLPAAAAAELTASWRLIVDPPPACLSEEPR